MQLSKRRPRTQQPRLLFVDENQAELWSRLSPEQQQLCGKPGRCTATPSRTGVALFAA